METVIDNTHEKMSLPAPVSIAGLASSDLPTLSHDITVSTVTGPTSLAPEHIEIMARVVSVIEALSTQRHARRDATGPASICHEISRPNQAAQSRVVIGAHRFAELIETFASCNQTFTPVKSFCVRRWFFGIQYSVKKLL